MDLYQRFYYVNQAMNSIYAGNSNNVSKRASGELCINKQRTRDIPRNPKLSSNYGKKKTFI